MTYFPGEPLISVDQSGNPALFVSVNGIPIVDSGTAIPVVGGEHVTFPDGSNGYDDLGTPSSHPADGSSFQVGTATFIASDGVTLSAPAVIPLTIRGLEPVVVGPSVAIGKAAVEQLRDRTRPNGVSDISVLTPIAGNVPAGVSLTATEVVVTGQNITLDGYDFGARGLAITGHAAMIRNCAHKSVIGVNPNYPVRIAIGGYLENMEFCEFEGAAGYGGIATVMVAQMQDPKKVLVAGPNAPHGRLGRMYRCRITKFRQDGPKLTGGTMEECYIGPPYGLPYASEGIYDAGTPYLGGQYVLSRVGVCYTPRTTGPNYVPGVGITGFAPPNNAGLSTDINWSPVNPHGDGWTMLAGFGGLRIYNNLFDWGDPPAPAEELGLNNVMRVLRNNNTAPLVEKVEIIGNVCYYKNTAAYPIQFGGGTTPAGLPARSYLDGPFEVMYNHLAQNGRSGYTYVHPTGADIPSRWVENRDSTTGALVAPPNNTASTV